MVSYHPDSRFLTDFAAGSLPMSEAVCVAAHLHYCGKCRVRVQQLADVGGQIFSRLEPEAPAASEPAASEKAPAASEKAPAAQPVGFDALMQRIDAEHIKVEPAADVEPRMADNLRLGSDGLPAVLRNFTSKGLSRLNWVNLGKSLRIAPVDVGDSERRETAIYDIRAGGRMPEHRHRGEEITVLLKGSFSDLEGKYSEGDFVVRNVGESHQPTATEDTDCICLVSLERTVRARSFWYRLLEPLVQYRLSQTSN